jgi:hypothetical protein
VTVRRIFELYAKHPSAVSVRTRLNALGIHDRKGRPWSSSSIEAILRNPQGRGPASRWWNGARNPRGAHQRRAVGPSTDGEPDAGAARHQDRSHASARRAARMRRLQLGDVFALRREKERQEDRPVPMHDDVPARMEGVSDQGGQRRPDRALDAGPSCEADRRRLTTRCRHRRHRGR